MSHPKTSVDHKEIIKLFDSIEDNLNKVLIWDAGLVNGYYKMGQLYTYKIFYKEKIQKESNIDDLKREAEKWFRAAAQRGDATLGYRFTYREYLELVGKMDSAKAINAVIGLTNPVAANKWEESVSHNQS